MRIRDLKEKPRFSFNPSLLFGCTFQDTDTLIYTKDLSDIVYWIRHHEINDFMNLRIKTYIHDTVTGTMVIKRANDYIDIAALSVIIYDDNFNIKYRTKIKQAKFLERADGILE